MKSPQYTQEFKGEAVRQVLDGQETLAQIARNLGISDNTLSTWKKTTLKWHGDPSALKAGEEAPQSELARLRRENRQLKIEQEILKKPWVSFRGHGEPIPVYSRAEQAVPSGPTV